MDTGFWMALSGALGVLGKWVYDIMRERANAQRTRRMDAIAEWQAHVERQGRAIAHLESGFKQCDEERHEGRIEVAELRTCLHFCMQFLGACRAKLIETGHDPGEAPTMPPPRVHERAPPQVTDFETRQTLHTAALVQEASKVVVKPPAESPHADPDR